MSSRVYFSKTITAEKINELYDMLGYKLEGNIAIKVHSGEKGNQNFLRPDFWKPVVDKIGGTVVECNTAYDGARNTTPKHIELIREHGWSGMYEFDLLDADGDDMVLDIENGIRIDKNYVGSHLSRYNALLVLSHFKGHPMGGFGGAVKQLSIGLASSFGKAYIHGAGEVDKLWSQEHDWFLESMADAASSVVKYFKGNAVYVNVMKNLSVDCDCCAVAEDPCMKDIGVLVSLDPVAIDKACLDLVYASKDIGREHLVKRIESLNGIHTLKASLKHGIGSFDYELIEI